MEKLVGKMPDRLSPYDGHDRRQPNIILTLLMYTVLFCAGLVRYGANRLTARQEMV